MSRKYPGLYLYYDWLKNLERLPRGVAMEIVLNLYHYAKDRRAPEPLSDPGYEIVLDMLMDQVKRSIGMSENVRQTIRCSLAIGRVLVLIRFLQAWIPIRQPITISVQ